MVLVEPGVFGHDDGAGEARGNLRQGNGQVLEPGALSVPRQTRLAALHERGRLRKLAGEGSGVGQREPEEGGGREGHRDDNEEDPAQ